LEASSSTLAEDRGTCGRAEAATRPRQTPPAAHPLVQDSQRLIDPRQFRIRAPLARIAHRVLRHRRQNPLPQPGGRLRGRRRGSQCVLENYRTENVAQKTCEAVLQCPA